jgi:formylglycine-generating enzyme required for sulfatase activity
MRRWFLSYNSQDLALMQALESALRRKDAGAQFFFAPKNLRPGGYWLPELAKGIHEATVFVLLIGEHKLGPWQCLEYYEALDKRVQKKDFPIILMLLKDQPAPGLPFLRQLHWIITADPAAEQTLAQLMDAATGGGSLPGELWRHTAPYRGLCSMTEADSDFFFGRERETVEVIKSLVSTPDHLPILLGNSGVGKSSLAQAGVLASLARQAWPENAVGAGAWPQAFGESRRWCCLKMRPGTDPLKALVEPFLDTWQFSGANPERVKHHSGWVELLRDGRATLHDLLDATERRYEEQQQPKPPGFFLYIDQGEELYVRAEENQRRRFSEIVATGLRDLRLSALMSMRSDFLGALQNDEPLFSVHRKIDVPPLREVELREVVSRPAQLLAARFENDRLAPDIAQRAATDSTKEGGALPLLSYLLDDMWKQMVERGDGVLRLPGQAIDLGRVLVERADSFLARDAKSEDRLKRIFTLKLANVREDGEPTRRRAMRSEFTDEEWRLVSDLADHPYRLLVTGTSNFDSLLGSEENEKRATAQAYAEVAHEAIYRCWGKLRDWIAAEREFLAWRSGLEAARRTWQGTPEASKSDALLMGLSLAHARNWLDKRSDDISKPDREFIESSVQRERAIRSRTNRIRSLVAVLFIGFVSGVAGLTYGGFLTPTYIQARLSTVSDVWSPKVLTAEQERTLKPKDSFKECSICIEMIVVPSGDFDMGSDDTEKKEEGTADETPRHKVNIPRNFAVSKYEVTFDQWDACVAFGGCAQTASDSGWGRGSKPVINVSWEDAQQYVKWLTKRTGKIYRLLSEAEWEYAARAGSSKKYSWGDEIGVGNANCDGCGSNLDNKHPAPVGSFAANAFGIFDMHGNVWEWVQDCFVSNYIRAPIDGTAVTDGDCQRHVVRGGSWGADPPYLRSALRLPRAFDYRSSSLGIRVARTLTP